MKKDAKCSSEPLVTASNAVGVVTQKNTFSINCRDYHALGRSLHRTITNLHKIKKIYMYMLSTRLKIYARVCRISPRFLAKVLCLSPFATHWNIKQNFQWHNQVADKGSLSPLIFPIMDLVKVDVYVHLMSNITEPYSKWKEEHLPGFRQNWNICHLPSTQWYISLNTTAFQLLSNIMPGWGLALSIEPNWVGTTWRRRQNPSPETETSSVDWAVLTRNHLKTETESVSWDRLSLLIGPNSVGTTWRRRQNPSPETD
jgi:hypothetical protein